MDSVAKRVFGLTEQGFLIDVYRNIDRFTTIIGGFDADVGLSKFDVDHLNRSLAQHLSRYGQCHAETVALCKVVETKIDALAGEMWKQMNENYVIKLTNKDIERYVNGHVSIVDLKECLISVELCRDQLQAINIALKEAYFAIRSIISERKVQAQELSK